MSMEKFVKNVNKKKEKDWEKAVLHGLAHWDNVFYFDKDGYGEIFPFDADFKKQAVEASFQNARGNDEIKFFPINNLVAFKSEAMLEFSMLKMLNARKAR